MKRLLLLLSTLLLAGFLASFSAHAVRVTGLYEALAPVKSQAPDQRSAALREILNRIAVKVSGQNVVPAGFAAGARVESLTEQFGYETREKNGKSQLYLWAKLNERRVTGLMRDAGLPVWPVERPASLVWIAVEDKEGVVLSSEDTEHPVLKEIQEAAERRGLPLVLPLLDLAEASQASYEQVSRLDPMALWPVSQKYGSQYMVIGHVQRTSKKYWRARWRVIETSQLQAAADSFPATPGEPTRLTPAVPIQAPIIKTPTGPLADVMAAAIDPLATRIAGQFASFASRDGVQTLDVTIDDVNGVDDYARSMKYLESLSPVTKVDIVSVEGQQVHYRLHTSADMAAVLKVIGLGGVLYARDSIDRLVYGLNPR